MSSASEADQTRWLRHVSLVQVERMTPEMREGLSQRAERQRRTETARRATISWSNHAQRSQTLLSEGLRQMSVANNSEAFEATARRWQSAQEASTIRASSMSETAAALRRNEAQAEAADAAIWRDDDDEAEGLAEVSRLVSQGLDGSEGPGPLRPLQAAEGDEAFEALVAQLRAEPADEVEMAAKFAMYETYGQEVERMRTELFALYEEHKADLPPAVARAMDAELRAVDREEALGIPDEARDWFVYHMMRQAARNNRHMSGVLQAFGKKLELLAKSDQSECPVCLEPFGADRPSETLVCCHCVCRACWEQWSAVMRGRPFCPLCRHEDFLGVIAVRDEGGALSAAPASPIAEGSGSEEASPQEARATRGPIRWLMGW